MSRKLTKEEFVERAKVVHKDKYTYDKFVYEGAHIKGIITCEKHGDFEQTPSDHLKGRGCPKCAIEKSKSNLEEFVERAKVVHKDKYTYDKFVYEAALIKGTITCEKHGDFKQSPNNHLSGKGCPKCAVEKNGDVLRSNLEEFVEKAKIVHKDRLYKYSYELFVYINSNTKGIIICPIHGDFKQTPANHLRGQGCPECWKERQREIQNIKWSDRFENGILYLIECWNDVERFVKIGVTSKTVEERYRQFGSMPYNYSILKEIQMDSNIVSDTEQYIINFYESYKPKISFGGDSECLSIDEKFQIVEFLENLEKDLNVYNSF